MIRSPVSELPPNRGDDAFLTDPDGIEVLFGPSARFYVPLLREIMPRVFQVQYDFEDSPTYERKLRDGTYTRADGTVSLTAMSEPNSSGTLSTVSLRTSAQAVSLPRPCYCAMTLNAKVWTRRNSS